MSDALHVSGPSGQRGPFFPKDRMGPDDSAGLPADRRGKSGILPERGAFSHGLGVLSSCLPPSKGPLPPQAGEFQPLVHLHSQLQKHLASKVGAAELRLTWKGGVPASPQPKQQLPFKARAQATLPLTIGVALDKAPLSRASVSYPEAEIGGVGPEGRGPGSGAGCSICAGQWPQRSYCLSLSPQKQLGP